MRPALQTLAAAAVVAGAIATAAAGPDHPTADFSGAQRANLTHRWSVQGRGGGSTKFAVLYGDCFYGTTYVSTYVVVQRTKPVPLMTSDGFSWVQPLRKSTTKLATGKLDTKKLDPTEQSSYLAEHQYAVNRLIGAEDSSVKKPVAGNATISRVVGSTTSRFHGDTQDVNSVWTYQGSVNGGPNDGRKLRGTVILVVKRAPAAEMMVVDR